MKENKLSRGEKALHWIHGWMRFYNVKFIPHLRLASKKYTKETLREQKQTYQYLKSRLQPIPEDVYEYALGILNKIDFENMTLQEKVNLLAEELMRKSHPIPEEKFDEFVVNQGIELWKQYKTLHLAVAGRARLEDFIRIMLQAYDTLREEGK